MQAFTQLCALAAPLEGRNVDTDQIIPARFLKKNRDALYKDYLFHDLRFDAQDKLRPEFVLNRPAFTGAQILVVDENFGCGSSREGAVYCLADFGIRAVIAPSFGDIFFNNCLKNGVLPLKLAAQTILTLRQTLFTIAQREHEANELQVSIDLERCTVQGPGLSGALPFSIEPFWQECLLKGVDELALTLGYRADIEAFERAHHAKHSWLATSSSDRVLD